MSKWWNRLPDRAQVAINVSLMVVAIVMILGVAWAEIRPDPGPERGADPAAVPSASREAGESPESPGGSPGSVTPSPTATPTDPAWQEMTSAGARAFAIHWAKVFNEARLTGDNTALKAISAVDCSDCRIYYQVNNRIKAAGGFIKRGRQRLLEVKELPTKGADVKAFTFQEALDWSIYKETAKAKAIRSENPDPLGWEVHMVWNPEVGWLMTIVDFPEPSKEGR